MTCSFNQVSVKYWFVEIPIGPVECNTGPLSLFEFFWLTSSPENFILHFNTEHYVGESTIYANFLRACWNADIVLFMFLNNMWCLCVCDVLFMHLLCVVYVSTCASFVSVAYVCGLCKESKEFAVSQLLKCLPLLKVGNTKAKAEYLNIMPMVMAHSIENNCHIEECRQLLSYSLIHPAISRDELAVLTIWMNSLEECHSNAYSSNTKTTKPLSVPLQNLIMPQYTTGSSDGLGNAPMISVHDKSSVLPVPNGVTTRYLVSTVVDQTSSGCDWPTMAVPSSVGGGRIGADLGTMSTCNQVHTGVIGTRNRTLTSSASVPLSDGLSHPFISWSMGSQVPAQHLSSPAAYTALQNPQGFLLISWLLFLCVHSICVQLDSYVAHALRIRVQRMQHN